MTLWFVFALMTALAVFAVLWPLGRGARPQREGNEATVYKDQLAEIERDVAAGLIGASEAEAARVEIARRLLAADDAERDAAVLGQHDVAPRGGGDRACRAADRWRWRFICRSARQNFPIFRLPSARRRRRPRNRWIIWWRRSKRIWRKIRPTAAAGTCWRRCWQNSAASTTRFGPIAIPSPIMATAPRAAPISARPLRPRRAASSQRRPRPSSNAPSL